MYQRDRRPCRKRQETNRNRRGEAIKDALEIRLALMHLLYPQITKDPDERTQTQITGSTQKRGEIFEKNWCSSGNRFAEAELRKAYENKHRNTQIPEEKSLEDKAAENLNCTVGL